MGFTLSLLSDAEEDQAVGGEPKAEAAVGKPSSPLAKRDYFLPRLKFVQVIRPILHHLFPFRKVGRPVVGATVGIAHGMGQWMFDVIGTEA